MIAVSQGHEASIGLEVFIKSFLCLSSIQQSKIKLFCNKESITTYLNKIEINYLLNANQIIFDDGSKLHCSFVNAPTLSQTMSCLNSAMEFCENNTGSILFTLPSSKDQFQYDSTQFSGHTDYFRKRYKSNDITMMFHSLNSNIMLLTEHISLASVANTITDSLISNKLDQVLSTLRKYEICSPQRIYLAGINPHCGEDGIIGDEDSVLFNFASKSKLNISVVPGDVLASKLTTADLGIYIYHDQGLSYFKYQSGLLGLNISCGLPYLRVSVDHGTAMDLAFKNSADYSGCLYGLKFSLQRI